MVRHPGRTAALLAAVLAVALSARAPTASAPSPNNPAPLPKGWGWLLAAGTVSAADASAGTATLAVTGQARGATYEGGAQWRSQAVMGSQVVHILPSTVIADTANQPATIASIHPGMPATVWAVVKPDASVLGLKLRLGSGSRQLPARPATTETPAGVTGAVMHAAMSMLELLTAQGASRKVIVTSATTIRNASGAVMRGAAIAPYDILRVEGTVNSDGSVAATRVDVEMEAATAAQVSGSVDQAFDDVGGLIMGGVAVAIAPGSFYFKGSGPGAWQQLVPGQPAVAYGAPIVSGNVLLGLRARVIAMR
jgi:Domain of unknown function (DUF5666)